MMPTPTKPTRSMSGGPFGGSEPEPLEPAERRGGVRGGDVLEADRAAVPGVVEQREQRAEVDRAGSGLVAARVVGDLHVARAVEHAAQPRRRVAFHAPDV